MRRLAMFGRRVVARRWCVALRRTRCFLLTHLLLALHFRSALLLLHLHRTLPLHGLFAFALLRLHLSLALLLHGLFAFALLRLHLSLALLLHLLLTRALLCGLIALGLHSRLLSLLFAFALSRLDFGRTLLRGRAIAG